jgi:chemotaxis family two-component system sensor kinase Cph1
MDLRFPASDIPQQARDLYRLNRLRLIADADYTPVPIEPTLSPVDDRPLDLSFAALRSVSPIHLQYMRNMGTFASMSISILVDDRLWGLISCHSVEPRRVGPPTRAACDLLGRNLGLQIASRQRDIETAQRFELKQRESSLLAALTASGDLAAGLSEASDLWRSLTDADGVAVLVGDKVSFAGRCPDEASIRRLAAWVQQRGTGDIFATHSLARDWEGGAAIKDVASGVIAAAISQLHSDMMFWFRGEIVHAREWAGEPTKPLNASPQGLSPRTSFENWKELVRLQSRPWTRAEIDSARDFRNAVTIFVLRRAEERAALTEQLQRSNRELEAFSYSISHDLRAPFRHIAGYAELLSGRNRHLDEKSQHYLKSIIEAALSAGRLVDDLLHFSQLGRASLSKAQVDVVKLVDEARRSLSLQSEDREIEWRIGALPPAYGDSSMLRQTFLNLIDNAVKYTRGRTPAIIEVSGEVREHETVYRVSDNGVGFEMAYVGKLFGVFQRLHRAEDFEGTGIGLALSKRILERHGGWIRADSIPDEATTFTFGLPTRREGAR